MSEMSNLLQKAIQRGNPELAGYAANELFGKYHAYLYWWKEFDTYKVGTVANSCSTMHKIAAKEFTVDDFSHEHLFT